MKEVLRYTQKSSPATLAQCKVLTKRDNRPARQSYLQQQRLNAQATGGQYTFLSFTITITIVLFES